MTEKQAQEIIDTLKTISQSLADLATYAQAATVHFQVPQAVVQPPRSADISPLSRYSRRFPAILSAISAIGYDVLASSSTIFSAYSTGVFSSCIYSRTHAKIRV